MRTRAEHDAGAGPKVCEVKVGDAWAPMAAEKAHTKYRIHRKRCPACHGQIVTMSTYANPPSFYMAHHRAHDGCPLDPRRFKGVARPHPKVLA